VGIERIQEDRSAEPTWVISRTGVSDLDH